MSTMGTLYKAENKNQQWNEVASYQALLIEDENGKNERWVLFTDKDLAKLPKFNMGKLGEELKAGRLYPMQKIGGKRVQYLLAAIQDKKRCIMRVGEELIKVAERRFKNGLNGERSGKVDLPKRGWFSNLLD